jgi:hypothetical protein
MLKKIISILLLALLLGGGIYFYFHLKKVEVPPNSAIKAIPIDAAFILESRKTLPLWKTISQTSEVWKELLDIPYFNTLNGQLKTVDSIIRENPEIGTMLENQPLFVSAHANGMNRFNFLFVCSVPDEASQSTLSSYLGSLKGNSPADNLQYEETTIHCVKIDEKNAFYYTIDNGIFIASFGPALIKESLRQLESGISLMQNAYFTKILNATGDKVIANILINFQTFTSISSSLFSRNFLPALSSMQDFGQWMELDVTINPDEVIMTGFTNCDSTGSQFLNLFQHQSSQEVKVASVVPSNTAFMICHEFSDYGLFHKNQIQYLGIHNKNRNRAEWISRIAQDYDMNIEKYFYPWINSEVAQIITEPSDSTLKNDTYVLIEANDINVAINKLSTIADTIAAKKNEKVYDTTYMQHKIYDLNLDNVTGNMLGSSFDGVSKSWFTSVANYVVFANSPNALKTFIYEYEGGNTLEKDSYYKDYIKQYVESESGVYIYNNMALSSVLYAKYLDKSCSADMKKHKSVFNKFHAASIQFSYLQGMFYTNLYFKRNSSFSKKISPLWQIGLDTTLAVHPYWVTDHITHGQYVMAEDKNESVYLINNNGHIEWKKKINGYMQSPIFQVDALKNHKIQYLFNTADNITFLDRKGNDVSGFPVKLKYQATAPLTVLDYDNTKNYKLLLPCDDMKIHEYDINGKPVQGWIVLKTKETVKCPARYLQVDKKDYIIFIDDAGMVYALDRKGSERLNLNNRMPSHIKDFYILQGKSLSDSYIMAADTLGTVFKLSLSGELTTLQYVKGNNTSTYFVPGPVDSSGKQEMIFINGNNLSAYTADKKELFRAKLKDTPNDAPLLFVYPDHTLRLGTIDKKNERIYLWDNSGNLCPGFPLFGSECFGIADMKNDGALHLVTGADNKIYVYRLQ